jgi:hypothetical protein
MVTLRHSVQKLFVSVEQRVHDCLVSVVDGVNGYWRPIFLDKRAKDCIVLVATAKLLPLLPLLPLLSPLLRLCS